MDLPPLRLEMLRLDLDTRQPLPCPPAGLTPSPPPDAAIGGTGPPAPGQVRALRFVVPGQAPCVPPVAPASQRAPSDWPRLTPPPPLPP
jgi:hypothetical protein